MEMAPNYNLWLENLCINIYACAYKCSQNILFPLHPLLFPIHFFLLPTQHSSLTEDGACTNHYRKAVLLPSGVLSPGGNILGRSETWF